MAELRVVVHGRPAPQGSKRLGAAGQLREQSTYLPSWRAAVKRAVYERYLHLGISSDALPLLRGPVGIQVMFRLDAGRRVDSPPDLDKLLRATWDALTVARVFEDDGRIVTVSATKRAVVDGEPTGADLAVWSVGEAA